MSVADGFNLVFGAASSPATHFQRLLLEFIIQNDNCAPVGSQSWLGLLTAVSAGRMGDDAEGMRGYWNYTETHRCQNGNQALADRFGGRPRVSPRPQSRVSGNAGKRDPPGAARRSPPRDP